MDYLRVGLVIAPQLIAGCLIYLLILKRTEVAAVELLSIGSVLGIVSCTIVDQVFVNLQMPRIGWLVAVLATIAVFLSIKRSQKIAIPTVLWKSEFTKSFLPIAAISAMALGTEWFWLFPSGVLFVIAAFFSIVNSPKYAKVLVRVSSLGAVLVGIFMIANRPKIWWFLYDSDYAFQQSLARSISQWGISDYLLLSGTKIKYHWFTYAWVGLIERSANTPTFFVFTRIAPIFFSVLIAGVIWTVIDRSSISRLRTFTATFVVLTASSYPLWGGGTKIVFLASPSQFYAFALLITAVFLLLEAAESKIRYSVVVIAVISAATILSKTMHGVILISALTATLCMQPLVKNKFRKTGVITCVISILSALLTYSLFVANSEAEAVFAVRFSDYFWQLQGDARLLPERVIDVLGFFTVISFAILPLFLILANFLQTKIKQMKLTDSLAIGSLLAGIVLSLIILAAWGENLYFIHASIVVTSVLSFASLFGNRQLNIIKPHVFVTLIALGIALCFLSFQIPSLNSGAQYAIVIRSMRIYASSLILITLAAGALTINLMRQKSSSIMISKFVVVASAMAVSFSVANWIDTMPRKHDEFSRIGDTYLATPDLEHLSEWVNNNSGEKEIVASNFGWPIILEGDLPLFSAPCKMYREKIYSGDCRRTNNALLVAYMHRRTWLQATSIHYTGFTPEMDSRQTATLGFASDPTAAQAQQMLDDGVDWFVVDRSTTDRTSWEPFATTEYTNDSFFALRLNKNN